MELSSGFKIVVCFLNKDIFKDDRLRLYSNQKKQVDFRNEEIVGDLKSRTNKHNAYPTTFFGYNKIKYLIDEDDKRVWKFYFLFTDGLYVWTYNKDQYEVKDYEHREMLTLSTLRRYRQPLQATLGFPLIGKSLSTKSQNKISLF